MEKVHIMQFYKFTCPTLPESLTYNVNQLKNNSLTFLKISLLSYFFKRLLIFLKQDLTILSGIHYPDLVDSKCGVPPMSGPPTVRIPHVGRHVTLTFF